MKNSEKRNQDDVDLLKAVVLRQIMDKSTVADALNALPASALIQLLETNAKEESNKILDEMTQENFEKFLKQVKDSKVDETNSDEK
jgi:hypothetical protein